MKNSNRDVLRLHHIIDAIEELEDYINGISESQFYEDNKTIFASIKQLEIIGEACNYLSSELKTSHGDVNWRSIINFRNLLIHHYFGIDFKIVWDIINSEIPVLKEKINEILKSLE